MYVYRYTTPVVSLLLAKKEVRRWRQAETDTFDPNERTKNGKEGKKKTNNNKPNLIETLLACLPFIRVGAKSRLQHSCQSSQIHDGWSPLFPLPLLSRKTTRQHRAPQGDQNYPRTLCLWQKRVTCQKYPPKKEESQKEKKGWCSKEPKKKTLQQRNTPKQAPYENKTPHRAASRFYVSQERWGEER